MIKLLKFRPQVLQNLDIDVERHEVLQVIHQTPDSSVQSGRIAQLLYGRLHHKQSEALEVCKGAKYC